MGEAMFNFSGGYIVGGTSNGQVFEIKFLDWRSATIGPNTMVAEIVTTSKPVVYFNSYTYNVALVGNQRLR